MVRLIILFIFAYFYLPSSLFGQAIFTLITPKELEKKKMPAVVKIESYQKKSKRKYAHGTGTFIDKNGLMVTNFHVGVHFFDKSLKIAFKKSDGEYVSGKVTVIKCSDERNIDLCLLKVDYRPDSWFVLSNEPIRVGYTSYRIGNGDDNEFNFTSGTTNDVSKKNGKLSLKIPERHNHVNRESELIYKNVEFVQSSALQRGGDSGGPLFDQSGRLIGINTFSDIKAGRSKNESRQLGGATFYSISGREVYDYVEKYWLPIKDVPLDSQKLVQLKLYNPSKHRVKKDED